MKIRADSQRRRAVMPDRSRIAVCPQVAVAVAILASVFTVPSTRAQTTAADAMRGDSYEIDMHVIAGGGDRTQGGCFDLTATIGQAVIGRATGGEFVLQAGFWPAVARDDAIFLNGFEDGSCPP